jgi:hypothetical protein
MSLSLTIGLASSTSGVRSSSDPRRSTNVESALRRTFGSRPMDSPSASPWDVSADAVRERVVARRDVGHELRRLVDEALQIWRVAVDLLQETAGRGQRGVDVAQRGVRFVFGAGLEVAQEAHGARHPGAGLGVEGVEDLVEVDRGLRAVGAERPAVVDVRLVGAAQLQVDVAVGHARQRGLADDRARPAAQGVVAVGGDRQRDLGEAVVGQRDVVDRADGLAGDLHLVALDELTGRDEARVDRVAAAAR